MTAGELSVRIRPAEEPDLDPIVDLAWDVAGEGQWIGAELPFDRQARRDRYVGLLASPDATVFVADASRSGGSPVVGEIVVSLAPFGVADIGMMVAKDWRGRGVGRALIEAGVQWAREGGAHKASLEVWPHNTAAIALYRRIGFVEEGRRRRHYRRRNGELWDALLMGLELS